MQFAASGGSLSGYTWSMDSSESGGSIVAGSGLYTAGTLIGNDTVRVTDGAGNTVTCVVRVSGQQTLAQLIQNAKSHADMISSTFVSQAEWIDYLNTGLCELWDLMILKYGAKYFHQPAFQFTTDGISNQYRLPPDFYKGTGVDLAVSAPDWWVSLKPFPWAERNRFALRNFQSFYGLSNLRYCYLADSVFFMPNPVGGQTFRLWYVPKASVLTSLTDVVDGVNGWEHHLELTAAIHALAKEESDTTQLEREKMEMEKRIEAMAENRDQGNAETVSDVVSSNVDSPWTGSSGGYGGNW